jgi:D-alanine-D-alanine ligase
VLAGGRSSEHEISHASAASVVAALDAEQFEVVPVTIPRAGGWIDLVSRGAFDVDVVLPVLHGPFGEDGTVQGLLELLDVPYVGAGVLGSALAMDKDRTKAVLRDAGIAVAPSITLRVFRDHPDDPSIGRAVVERLGLPVFVKPVRLGSSVGISRVEALEELPAALELAFRHDDKVLVEQAIVGREVECGVLGNDAPVASAVGEIVPGTTWYDYEAKYADGGSEILIPADLPADAVERIQSAALAAFEACDLAGMARIDFFLEASGRVVLNEVNTIPGFTDTSVYARLFDAVGVPYPQLLERLIDLALERHARRSGLLW